MPKDETPALLRRGTLAAIGGIITKTSVAPLERIKVGYRRSHIMVLKSVVCCCLAVMFVV